MSCVSKSGTLFQPPFQLELDEIHLFYFDVEPKELSLLEVNSLSSIERDDYSKKKESKSKIQHFRALSILRHLLSFYLELPTPSSVQITTNPFGKPIILPDRNEKKIHFNISHAEEFLMIGLSWENELGVDIEKRGVAGVDENVAAQFMAPVELERFHDLNARERELFFYQQWTKKESVLKAKGVGLNEDPKAIVFSNSEKKGSLEESYLDQGEVWKVQNIVPNVSHISAVAHKKNGDVRMRIKVVT